MGSCVPVRERAACAVGCEEKFWAPGPPVSFGPLGIATDHALELTVNHWPVTQAELETFERATVAWPRSRPSTPSRPAWCWPSRGTREPAGRWVENCWPRRSSDLTGGFLTRRNEQLLKAHGRNGGYIGRR